MKSKAFAAGVSLTALLLASCGGGGGGGTPAPAPSSPPTPTLQVSGTVATGAALADADVEVKCASGSATAKTAAAGTYSVTITQGALPCMVEAKKTVGAAQVSLHSVVETGTLTTSDARTSAAANVTPVTEMIVAQLAAAVPEDTFKAFQAGAVTQERVQAAATAIVAALKAAGIDLGSIDPLKAQLVAANGSTQGNAYDQLLDALAVKVNRDTLKVLVNQIAIAAQSHSTIDLASAMQAVSGGSLANCPVAVSGKYRFVPLKSGIRTYTVDFKTLQMVQVGTTDSMALTKDPFEACAFTATGTFIAAQTTVKVVIGAGGVGTFSAKSAADSAWNTIGYLYPAQSHAYADFRGTWTALQTDFNGRKHTLRQLTFGDQQQLSSCQYDSSWTCVASPSTQAVTLRTDGGVTIELSPTEAVAVYGYRAPNGAFTVYGAAEPVGSYASVPSLLVATQLEPATLPVVGAATASWSVSHYEVSGALAAAIDDPGYVVYTTLAVDTATSTATRQRGFDGRLETARYNSPLTGLRSRDAGTYNGSNFPQIYQVPLKGMSTTVSVNLQPFNSFSDPTPPFQYSIAVVKP